jgi:hypothetical protein
MSRRVLMGAVAQRRATSVPGSIRPRSGMQTDKPIQQAMTRSELTARSGASPTTVRDLVPVLSKYGRQPRTLAAISDTLGWPDDHLAGCSGVAPGGNQRKGRQS